MRAIMGIHTTLNGDEEVEEHNIVTSEIYIKE